MAAGCNSAAEDCEAKRDRPHSRIRLLSEVEERSVCVDGGGDGGGSKDVLSPHVKDPRLNGCHSVMRDHRPLPLNELLSSERTRYFVLFVASLITHYKSNSKFLGFRSQKKNFRQPFINLLPDAADLCTPPASKHQNNCANSKYLITGKLLRLSSASRLFWVCLLVWSRELQECEQREKPTMLLEPPKPCTQATCVVPVVLCVPNKLPLKRRHN